MYNFLITNESQPRDNYVFVSHYDRLTEVLSAIACEENVGTNCLSEAFYLFLSDIDRAINTAHNIGLNNVNFQFAIACNQDDNPDDYMVEMVDNTIFSICHYNKIDFKVHHDA